MYFTLHWKDNNKQDHPRIVGASKGLAVPYQSPHLACLFDRSTRHICVVCRKGEQQMNGQNVCTKIKICCTSYGIEWQLWLTMHVQCQIAVSTGAHSAEHWVFLNQGDHTWQFPVPSTVNTKGSYPKYKVQIKQHWPRQTANHCHEYDHYIVRILQPIQTTT